MKSALTLICLSQLLMGCASERVITKVVPVPGPERIRYVPVPAELTKQIPPASIPAPTTYGAALKLWNRDRDTIQILNGQLAAIENLND